MDEQQEQISLINPQSYERLMAEGYTLVHIGLIMIRLQTMHRRGAGTMALVAPRQTNWTDDRAITAVAEVDLSQGSQLVYFVPDTLMTIEAARNRLELVVQTRGYDSWTGREPNLLTTRAMVGILTNTSHAAFRCHVNGVVNYLASNGIRAISGEPTFH